MRWPERQQQLSLQEVELYFCQFLDVWDLALQLVTNHRHRTSKLHQAWYQTHKGEGTIQIAIIRSYPIVPRYVCRNSTSHSTLKYRLLLSATSKLLNCGIQITESRHPSYWIMVSKLLKIGTTVWSPVKMSQGERVAWWKPGDCKQYLEASSGGRCVRHALGPGEMKGDLPAKGLEQIGELGKGTESKRAQLPKCSLTQRNSLNRGTKRNVCQEDAILGLSPAREGEHSHC